MEKFVNNYENKMPCDRVIWMLIFLGGCQVIGKEGSEGGKIAGIFHCG